MNENYLKIIERKNYEATYPKPMFLRNHQMQNPKAFYIQILGCRGVGKSTFLNRFFQFTGLRKNSNELYCNLLLDHYKQSDYFEKI